MSLGYHSKCMLSRISLLLQYSALLLGDALCTIFVWFGKGHQSQSESWSSNIRTLINAEMITTITGFPKYHNISTWCVVVLVAMPQCFHCSNNLPVPSVYKIESSHANSHMQTIRTEFSEGYIFSGIYLHCFC